jgi:hypothetical protein
LPQSYWDLAVWAVGPGALSISVSAAHDTPAELILIKGTPCFPRLNADRRRRSVTSKIMSRLPREWSDGDGRPARRTRSPCLAAGRHDRFEERRMKCTRYMTRSVVSVHPDTSTREIARLMLDNRISAVPVIDNDGPVPGVVSRNDLNRPDRAARTARGQAWLETFAEGEPLAPELFAGCILRATMRAPLYQPLPSR